jgi:hypothetical protein
MLFHPEADTTHEAHLNALLALITAQTQGSFHQIEAAPALVLQGGKQGVKLTLTHTLRQRQAHRDTLWFLSLDKAAVFLCGLLQTTLIARQHEALVGPSLLDAERELDAVLAAKSSDDAKETALATYKTLLDLAAVSLHEKLKVIHNVEPAFIATEQLVVPSTQLLT